MSRGLLLTEDRPARRGFLRSLAIAATGAAATHRLILPATTLVTPADASARLQHHLDGLQAAFRDLYPEGEFSTRGNHQRQSDPDLSGRLVRGELAGALVLTMRTAPLDGVAAFIAAELARRGHRL